MAGIVVSIDGYDLVMRVLGKMSSPRMKDLAEFLGEEVMTLAADAFQSESDPVTGKRWDPSQRSRRTGGKTLTKSADLQRSLDYVAYPDGSVLAGSPSIYARIHQLGGDAGRNKSVRLPQRRYLGWPPDYPRRLSEDGTVRDLLGVAA